MTHLPDRQPEVSHETPLMVTCCPRCAQKLRVPHMAQRLKITCTSRKHTCFHEPHPTALESPKPERIPGFVGVTAVVLAILAVIIVCKFSGWLTPGPIQFVYPYPVR